MNLLALACLILPAAAFDVLSFPLPSPGAAFFAAKIDPTGGADLFVLDQHTLTVYRNADPAAGLGLKLRPGTSAVDVADLNGDGRSEVLSVAGNAIVRYNLPPSSNPEGVELFQLDTQFSRPALAPFLQVLVVDHEGVPVLALPRNDVLELRSSNGALLASSPLEAESASPVLYGNPFTYRQLSPSQIGPPGALEFRISDLVSFGSAWPSHESGEETEGLQRRRGTARQMVEAADLRPEAWPWFPLRTQPEAQDRVLYAAADASFREILIRVRSLQPRPETGELVLQAGPPRRYPGMLVRRDLQQPDFNGDGYADLMLWSPAEPSITVNSLTNAAVHGNWPILLVARYFLPATRRFDPDPAAHLRLECPLAWYLDSPAEAPLANVVFDDFNGDNRTDFACSGSGNSFSVWLFSADGLAQRPSFHHQFEEDIQEVAFTSELRDRNRAAIVLRGTTKVFLVAPGADLPAYPVPPSEAAAGKSAPLSTEPVRPKIP